MKLILRTHCTNEFLDGCSYALVDLTPTLARTVLRRREIFEANRRNDPDLNEIRYYNGDADYFSALPTTDGTSDEIERRLAKKGFTQAPTDFCVDDELLERTECGQMVISTVGVRFQCYPKHCDPLVETHEIDFKTVEEAHNAQAKELQSLALQNQMAVIRDPAC
jgi:hypothetical protein